MQYLLAASLLSSLLSVASARALHTERDSRSRAAYTLDNDAAGASIIAMKISLADGTLSLPVKTSTGGRGLLANTVNGQGGPDGLFGQNAVVVSQDVCSLADHSGGACPVIPFPCMLISLWHLVPLHRQPWIMHCFHVFYRQQ